MGKKTKEAEIMNNRTRGIICIILAAFSFALMSVFIRLSGDIPSMQKAFFRNAVAVVFAFVILKKNHVPFHPAEKKNWVYLLARAAFGTVGLICNFYAVDHLNLSDANMLNKMSPFFAIIVSFFLLKEKLTVVQGLGVVAAFVGSLFIIKPNPSNMELVPSLVGLLGGFGAGVAYSFVRLMGKKGVNSNLIVFVFSTFSCLVCLPFFIAIHAPMTPVQLLCLILAGACGCAGQFAITSAYQFAPAKEISVYDYSQVVFSALMGWAIFGQLPDVWSLLGYVLICGTGILMFLYQKKHTEL